MIVNVLFIAFDATNKHIKTFHNQEKEYNFFTKRFEGAIHNYKTFPNISIKKGFDSKNIFGKVIDREESTYNSIAESITDDFKTQYKINLPDIIFISEFALKEDIPEYIDILGSRYMLKTEVAKLKVQQMALYVRLNGSWKVEGWEFLRNKEKWLEVNMEHINSPQFKVNICGVHLSSTFAKPKYQKLENNSSLKEDLINIMMNEDIDCLIGDFNFNCQSDGEIKEFMPTVGNNLYHQQESVETDEGVSYIVESCHASSSNQKGHYMGALYRQTSRMKSDNKILDFALYQSSRNINNITFSDHNALFAEILLKDHGSIQHLLLTPDERDYMSERDNIQGVYPNPFARNYIFRTKNIKN